MEVPRGRGLVSKSVSWPLLFFMSSDFFSTGMYYTTTTTTDIYFFPSARNAKQHAPVEKQSELMKNRNGHETDLETSPRPLGTTIFEEI